MQRDVVRQTELGLALAAAIAERGPITFADYMQIALYHPQGGYYTNPAHTPQGWEGDYITSSDLHPLFGTAIGRQLGQIWKVLGQPVPFVVLEGGAGRGLLARDICAWARADTSDAPAGFATALRYRQRDVDAGPDGVREWEAGNAKSLVGDASGLGLPHVILSNELIDALPVHVVEHTAAGLQEVYADAPDGTQLVERLGPPTPEVAAYLERYRIPWARMPVGWRAEVNLAAETWLADMAQCLAPRGVILTIDYGDTAQRLYTRERRRGTLLCYYRHELSEQPLAYTGLQDITAHVNFSALIAVGRSHGLKLAGLVTQRDFLLNLGIQADVTALGQQLYPLADSERHTDAGQRDYLRRATLRHAVNALIDPHGLGGFRVLIQQRGLPGAGKVLQGLNGITKMAADGQNIPEDFSPHP